MFRCPWVSHTKGPKHRTKAVVEVAAMRGKKAVQIIEYTLNNTENVVERE
jgi:hypothetical protein